MLSFSCAIVIFPPLSYSLTFNILGTILTPDTHLMLGVDICCNDAQQDEYTIFIQPLGKRYTLDKLPVHYKATQRTHTKLTTMQHTLRPNENLEWPIKPNI
ncbi:hypothetical protein ILYODFUR_024920 [Ilyodon furcidens]|uniref:Secreted protein n=1 Tax=Ilyodon furcidens TaxID=33524 RepID=A0ABV0U896_9TELE